MELETRLMLATALFAMTSGVGGAICERISSNYDIIERKQAPVMCGASKAFRWLSALTLLALIIGMFFVFGFSWFIVAGLSFFVVLRAVIMILIILFSKGAKPLPKWFDIMMYEALAAGILVTPSLLIGTILSIA